MSKSTSIKCNHNKDAIMQYLAVPTNTGINDFLKLVDYFQYKAPLIDSIHSSTTALSADKEEFIFNRMMAEANLNTRSKFLKRIQKNSLEIMDLDGEAVCFKCPRLLCNVRTDETQLRALLRHIRNSLAHGRVYIKKAKNQTYVLLEDIDSKNKKERITARIVVTKAILNRWKNTLEKSI